MEEQKEPTQQPQKTKRGDGIMSKVIITSLFVSMIVGGSFGFLTSLAINGDLGRAIQGQILSKDFIDRLENTLKKDSEDQVVPRAQDENSVVDVVKKTNPAVVSIIITRNVPAIDQYDIFDFFGLTPPDQGQNGTQKQEVGGGSGFLVSPDGLIVTNKHVVADTTAEYTVLTNDEKKYSARVLGRDPVNDIAIIKINPQLPQEGDPSNELPFLKIGDSSSLEVGQTVVAIGNSLGEFRNTVSRGIVSGLRRNIIAGSGFGQTESLTELIQTDAAINQGNSGGPLLNLTGEVVGVNVAIAQNAQNIGFALPINSVKNAIDSVKNEGRIITPFIGIRYVMNNSIVAAQNNLPYDYGAFIFRGEGANEPAIISGSPADRAGIKEGDLVLEIDGKKVTESFTPSSAISEKRPGDVLTFKVWGGGEVKDLQLSLTER